jgi:hypothetical protein
MVHTRDIYFDEDNNACDKTTDEVLFHVSEEARQVELQERRQKRLPRTCLPLAAREQSNVVGRISPKLIAASVNKARAAAARKS